MRCLHCNGKQGTPTTRRDVSEETKHRIKKTAEALGYFPNAAARALKTNRSYNIGVPL